MVVWPDSLGNPFRAGPRPFSILGLVSLTTTLALAVLAAPTLAFQITDLQRPESFLADPSGSQYFISNANGDPDVKDNNGFITKLDADGKLVQLQFIRGGENGVVLHSPQGMAIVGQTLYVADLEAVRGFDTRTGRPVATIPFPNDAKLADLAHDEHGLLYVSDTDSDAIYRIDTARGHAVSTLVRDKALAGPRGLAVHPKTGKLIVVSWKKGKILEVDATGAITVLASNSFFSSRFHNLHGVDFDTFGNMYVSDFTAGKVWRMRPNRKFDVIAEFLPYPADIGVDRKKHLILVPYHYGNAAEMNGLESPIKKDSRKRTFADYGFDFKKPPPETK
jgi:DNA-binding beta-propeller fold protein YncE